MAVRHSLFCCIYTVHKQKMQELQTAIQNFGVYETDNGLYDYYIFLWSIIKTDFVAPAEIRIN